MTARLSFVAVGDIAPDRDDPAGIFDRVRDRLRRADLGFCQLEVNLTRRGARLPQARHTMRGDPAIADAVVAAGLGIVSFAGNHCMDWGRRACSTRCITWSGPAPARSAAAPTSPPRAGRSSSSATACASA